MPFLATHVSLQVRPIYLTYQSFHIDQAYLKTVLSGTNCEGDKSVQVLGVLTRIMAFFFTSLFNNIIVGMGKMDDCKVRVACQDLR